MNNKVTKIRFKYPEGDKPNICVPEKNNYHRFLLGRIGLKPLVAVCMNPSAANEKYSDKTINRIISISKKLDCDGWIIANVYPERATHASKLDEYNIELAEENVKRVIEFLLEKGISEVFGAWGDLKYTSLKKGKKLLLSGLKQHNIRVYTFALNKSGEPVHPLNSRVKQEFLEENKHYLVL